MKNIFRIIIWVLPVFAKAQHQDTWLIEGNSLFTQGDFQQAAAKYRLAAEADPSNNKARYNLSLAEYRLGNSDTALAGFEKLSVLAEDKGMKSASFYNKGAILSKENKLPESIEAYKSALRLNPDDREARENLQKAMLELNKRKQPPEKKDKKKKDEPKKNPPRPSMNRKQEEEKLKQMQQKEQKTQQKLQSKPQNGAGMEKKDW